MPSICRVLSLVCLVFAVPFAAFAGEAEVEKHAVAAGGDARVEGVGKRIEQGCAAVPNDA